MNGSTADDNEFAGIILWLLVTDQEAHVSESGEVRLKRSTRAARRERERNRQRLMFKAELKRMRKAAKHATV